MFAKYQTLIYRPNGQRAAVKETPNNCSIHLGLPGQDAVPAYVIQFYIDDGEGGLATDHQLYVAPQEVVEQHFRIPGIDEIVSSVLAR